MSGEQPYRCPGGSFKTQIDNAGQRIDDFIDKMFKGPDCNFVKTRGFSRRHRIRVIGDIIKSLPTGFILLIKDFNL